LQKPTTNRGEASHDPTIETERESELRQSNILSHYRRNFLAFLGEASLFGVGLVFASTTIVLPDFVSHMTDSAVFVGLIVSLSEGAWRLPQLFFANLLTNKRRKKPWLTRAGLAGRPAYLLYAIALGLGLSRLPTLGLALFFLLHCLFYINLALDSVVWWDVFGKAIPIPKRGRLLGLSAALRGILSVGAGYLIARLFAENGPSFPFNYAVIFALSGSSLLLSLISWMFIVEPEEPVEEKRVPWRHYLPQLGDILRNNCAFRRLLIVRLLAGFDGLALGLYVLFGLKELGLSAATLGLFTAVQTVGGILAGLGFGVLSERVGNHRVIQVATAISLTAPLVALGFRLTGFANGTMGSVIYAWIFLAIGVFLNANFIGFSNYAVELAPTGQRGTYIGLFNTVSGMIVVWPAVGGWLLERTSYLVLFALTAGLLFVAFVSSLWLPRVRHLALTFEQGAPPRR